MNEHKAEATAVADEIRKALEPKIIKLEDDDGVDRDVALIPSGFAIHSVKKMLDEYRTAPERRKGQATFTKLDSFIEHVNRFKDDDSAVFLDEGDEPSITCVLDYHRKGPDGDPRFGEHRSTYEFTLSEEWSAWVDKQDETFGQADFAEFIEERLQDVSAPASALAGAKKFSELMSCAIASPQQLLELSRGLVVHATHRVANHVNLATGESTIHFAEDHTDAAGKPMKIPGAFIIQIPVFYGGAHYQIPARLRYRKDGPVLRWSYKLYREDAVYEDALAEAAKKVKETTELPVYSGSPEK